MRARPRDDRGADLLRRLDPGREYHRDTVRGTTVLCTLVVALVIVLFSMETLTAATPRPDSKVLVDGAKYPTPHSFVSWEGYKLNTEAPPAQLLGGTTRGKRQASIRAQM